MIKIVIAIGYNDGFTISCNIVKPCVPSVITRKLSCIYVDHTIYFHLILGRGASGYEHLSSFLLPFLC